MESRLGAPSVKIWSYSLSVLVIYIATFLLWQQFPSRGSFLFGGIVSAALMLSGMLWALQTRYFVDKADVWLHALVIVDVLVEGSLYEVARLAGYVASGETELLNTLHSANTFYGCAIGFALVLGFHRWRVMKWPRIEAADYQVT
jgi:hypothetical protein